MNDRESAEKKIAEIKKRISELPAGTITYKNIRGRKQPYLQWTESGKSMSRYIKTADREAVFAAVAERRRLQEELRIIEAERPALDGYVKVGELRSRFSQYEPSSAYGTMYAGDMNESSAYISSAAGTFNMFTTRVIQGDALREFAAGVEGWDHRDCYADLMRFIQSGIYDKVAIIYGLRRTGKTTLLKQAVANLIPGHIGEIAYIKLRRTDSLGSLNMDMDRLAANGIRYFFLDEITLLPDFIDGAGVLSDIYAARGIKIILSGTDSLGFWFSKHDELYDRAVMIHTTWIPFREHSRLLGISDIDEYIRYGGTLRAGTLNYGISGKAADDACFRDEESTREYIDTAICRNIQHSLALNEDGRHFVHLQELYEAGELTGAINRIIEDTTHRFLISVLTRPFVSHDYGSAANVLRKERDPGKRSNTLDILDREQITKVLAEILEIRSKEEQLIGIREEHVIQIREYLKMLDLIAFCPVEPLVSEMPAADESSRVLITQPGIRYAQAQALAYSVMQDKTFRLRPNEEKRHIIERILEEVKGRMLEELVLLETIRTAPLHVTVCHIDNGDGSDIDMLTYDELSNTCVLYEVKHSAEAVPEQYHILTDPKYCDPVSRRFGSIAGKAVLYRGKDIPVNSDGIEYRNVCDYLKRIKN